MSIDYTKPNKKVEIVFFGTPEFAVPTLKALYKANFCEITSVVTMPDKPIGRHHSVSVPSPVKKIAKANNIKVYDSIPQKSALKKADLGIVIAYGKIIPKQVIESFKFGVLNIHPSLLPKYRGSSPVQATILNRDKQTGITIIKLDDEMDHGPIVAQKKIDLSQNETSSMLHDALAKEGAKLMIKILPDYINGKIKPKEQNHSRATFTKKLSKKDAEIQKNSTIESVESFVRAMNPWPGAWTTLNGKKLIIWEMKKNGAPSIVQLEGKKKMSFEEFKKGRPGLKINDFLWLR